MKSDGKSATAAITKAEITISTPRNPIVTVAPARSKLPPAVELDETLTEEQRELLASCESDISANLKSAFVLGFRLEQIREQRLYRATHKTFQSYCAQRFDFSKTHANRLIQAHLCEQRLRSVKGGTVYVPTKESQVRWICDLDPEQQIEVAAKVMETVGEGTASAVDFGKARKELYPRLKTAPRSANGTNVIAISFDPNLVSFLELRNRLQNISNVCDQPAKKQETINLIAKLVHELDLWAAWQKKQLNVQEAA